MKLEAPSNESHRFISAALDNHFGTTRSRKFEQIITIDFDRISWRQFSVAVPFTKTSTTAVRAGLPEAIGIAYFERFSGIISNVKLNSPRIEIKCDHPLMNR